MTYFQQVYIHYFTLKQNTKILKNYILNISSMILLKYCGKDFQIYFPQQLNWWFINKIQYKKLLKINFLLVQQTLY